MFNIEGGEKMNSVAFISLWVTNSLFFYIAFLVFPDALVLGNNIRSPIVASLLSGLLLTLIVGIVPSVLKMANLKVKEEQKMAFIYFVFNALGIWLIARMATITGFGISTFWVALVLAFVVNFLQWGVWKATSGKTK